MLEYGTLCKPVAGYTNYIPQDIKPVAVKDNTLAYSKIA